MISVIALTTENYCVNCTLLVCHSQQAVSKTNPRTNMIIIPRQVLLQLVRNYLHFIELNYDKGYGTMASFRYSDNHHLMCSLVEPRKCTRIKLRRLKSTIIFIHHDAFRMAYLWSLRRSFAGPGPSLLVLAR